MKTVQDVSKAFRHELAALYDAREIDSLCMNVLADITGMSNAKIKAFPELEIPLEQAEIINKILNRLKTGEPLQYILEYTEFHGLPFKVNPSVLIPRPETEELVEWALNSWRSSVGSWQSPLNLLDIGTGSGCIAVSLKKNLPDAKVSAIDISPKALQIAKENALLNELEIYFIEADILKPQAEIDHSTFEIIISNPPYVTLEDKKQMHTNVTDFEPYAALFVPEHDPLIFYKAIADFAATHLENDGLLFFEINESYGKEIVELLTIKSFKNIELRKDISGRDRMIKAFYSGV
ncbi:MAG: peptide chain release factor N(5)-glutamine methyltransferase [Mucilaginibacter sp.]